jgi:hypothetical protein
MEVAANTTRMQHARDANTTPMRKAYAETTPTRVKRPRTRQGKERLLTLAAIDGRTAARQAIDQLIDALTLEMGGADRVTVREQQDIEDAAILKAIIDDLKTRWVGGEQIPLGELFAAINTKHRVLAGLEAKRPVNDVPSVADYLDQRRRHQHVEIADAE